MNLLELRDLQKHGKSQQLASGWPCLHFRGDTGRGLMSSWVT